MLDGTVVASDAMREQITDAFALRAMHAAVRCLGCEVEFGNVGAWSAHRCTLAPPVPPPCVHGVIFRCTECGWRPEVEQQPYIGSSSPAVVTKTYRATPGVTE